VAYTAKDIDVLEGLEPVRKRPAMYIGGTDSHGYHHLLWEIVDNSVDEAINGHASRIEVVLDADHKGATVTDNGRGIPVDTHPKHKKSALELILTTLHAGGKFEGKSYQVAGGLHGVGSSVVNALSSDMTATVWRQGKTYSQTYSRGKAKSKLKRGGKTSKRGTSIHFRPDQEIFGKRTAFDTKRVAERLEAKTYLHRGLKILFVDEKTGDRQEFEHPGGIVDFLEKLVAERSKPSVHKDAFTIEHEEDPRFEVALRWTESTDEVIRSYANGIPTGSGGTHENGFKQGLAKAIRNRRRHSRRVGGAGERLCRGAAVPRADQRPAQQSRGNRANRDLGSDRVRAVVAQQQDLGGIDHCARHHLGEGPGRQPRSKPAGIPQDRGEPSPEPAG
jgi:DNA gyrase subunit B